MYDESIGPRDPNELGACGLYLSTFLRLQLYDDHATLLAGATTDCGPVRWSNRPVRAGRVPGETTLALVQALGHVLAEDVCSRLPMPNWPLAKVAGYAICSAQWQQASEGKAIKLSETPTHVPGQRWSYIGFGLQEWLTPIPGHPKRGAIKVGAMRPMPFDTDTVLHAMSPFFRGDTLKAKRSERVVTPPPAGHDVLARGAHLPAGAPLLKRGQPLGAKELAMLAAGGYREVKVFNKPRVGVLVMHQALREPDHNAPTGWLPDCMTPLIVGLLTQWGHTPEDVCILPLDATQGGDECYAQKILDFTNRFDYSIVYSGDKPDIEDLRDYRVKFKGRPLGAMFGYRASAPDSDQTPEDTDGAIEGCDYQLYAGSIRSRESLSSYLRVPLSPEEPGPDVTPHWITTFSATSSPLAALLGMYLHVRPILKALSGVGAFPVIDEPSSKGICSGAEPIPPQAPLPPNYFVEQDGRVQIIVNNRAVNVNRPPAPESVRHFARGASEEHWRRHLPVWFTGVVTRSAPRDPERRWLQLATLHPQPDGRTGLRVLPTDEFEVARLNQAQAICMIEPGEGDCPEGSVVHYFLLD